MPLSMRFKCSALSSFDAEHFFIHRAGGDQAEQIGDVNRIIRPLLLVIGNAESGE